MEATYYKDSLHSYMIIPCPPQAGTTGYQYRMLEMNRIEGILPCGLRYIDGKSFLYYEITGKQSLTGLYEGRKIPGAELFRLLKALDTVSETLSGFLLDEQHLVLTGEQIFYDLSSGKYDFTYYPGEMISPEVFRFLADGIDGKDKRAAAAAYRLCSAAGDGRQTLREAIREEASQKERPRPWEIISEEEIPENIIIERNTERKAPVYADKSAGQKPPGRMRRLAAGRSAVVKEDMSEENERQKIADQAKGSGKKKTVVGILTGLLLLAGAGGLIAVQFFYYLSQRERRLCIAGAILLTISACLIIVETILRIREEGRKRREEEEKRKPSYLESDEKDLPVFGETKADDYRLGREENYNTVCFGEQYSEQFMEENYTGGLYGRDGRSWIDLRTLPITVGKAQAYVDVVLEDFSVSRVHARIYKGERGSIEIRDLGSTNGTFINGIKLGPNEKRCLQRGDEIRFGRVEYEYR